jgi:hypothetical protein
MAKRQELMEAFELFWDIIEWVASAIALIVVIGLIIELSRG